ncbi:MAG TPA: TraR/DksA C4-type zinc finger protein [Pirellulales bacterium]|nr:TraR/DksA C4-type zinc finger protein [Pirellulales bacterium]
MSTRPCEICGELIDPERLEAMPQTTLCTLHAQQIARYGGEFKLSASQTRLSKAGSLKKNYGDVTVTQFRNARAIEKLKQDYERGDQA